MVGANKILTVSYGTFSCTLEGFDDSFSTMKAIAEYFRDLAADDRYFGAEPATPDADMLARIAEREIQKRVDARVGENGVVLRAQDEKRSIASAVDEETDAASEPPAETKAKAETPVAQDEPAKTSAATTAEEPAFETPTAAEASTFTPEPEVSPEAASQPVMPAAPQEAADESVAAKLSRIRAVIARGGGTGAVPGFDATEQPVSYAPQTEIEEVDFDAEDEDVSADEAVVPTEHGFSTDEDTRVEESEADFYEETAYFEEDYFAEDAHVPAEDLKSEEEIQSKPEAEEPAEKAEEPVISDEDFEKSLEAALAAQPDAAPSFDQPEEEEETGAEKPMFLEEPIFSEDGSGYSAEDFYSEEDYSEIEEPAPEAARAEEPEEVEDERYDDFGAELSDMAQRARAQVYKIGKDATAESDEALTEAEDDEFETEAAEASVEEAKPLRRGREILAEESADEESDVDRLIEETNSQLDNPESSRRRSAISHLRAAVIATVADRKSSDADRDEQRKADVEAYRADLAEAVRAPRAPAAHAEEEEHEAEPEQRHAPLVLVSEQRVDTRDEAPEEEKLDEALDEEEQVEEKVAATPAPTHPVKPVRPRRVSRASLQTRSEDHYGDDSGDDGSESKNIFASGTSFERFATDMGATELPDAMEAAAAYTRFIEGQPSFRRQRPMSLVAELVGPENYEREEGLRAFGTLLRDGTIRKVSRGQFEVADSTRFCPKHQKM